mmetsp:Transcript_9186/g.15650  ORF Transcript_9186/g.15650 Transcript_9186/m.15650 type:complete len:299 (+) Transcript_9186:916-1812(+)
MWCAEATETLRSPGRTQCSPTPVMFSKLVGLASGTRAFCWATCISSLASGCSLEISAEPTAHHSAFSASCRTFSRTKEAEDPGIGRRNLACASSDSDAVVEASELELGLLERLPSSSGVSHTVGNSTSSTNFRDAAIAACWRKVLSNCCQPWSSKAQGHTAAAETALGRPTVKVPVLSKTTAFTREPSSSGSAPLRTRMPHLAATPVAAITAVGVARPKAQGQAISRTLRPCSSTKKALSSSGHELLRPSRIELNGTTSQVYTSKYQVIHVKKLKATMLGTKTRATESATRCTGARFS